MRKYKSSQFFCLENEQRNMADFFKQVSIAAGTKRVVELTMNKTTVI